MKKRFINMDPFIIYELIYNEHNVHEPIFKCQMKRFVFMNPFFIYEPIKKRIVTCEFFLAPLACSKFQKHIKLRVAGHWGDFLKLWVLSTKRSFLTCTIMQSCWLASSVALSLQRESLSRCSSHARCSSSSCLSTCCWHVLPKVLLLPPVLAKFARVRRRLLVFTKCARPTWHVPWKFPGTGCSTC